MICRHRVVPWFRGVIIPRVSTNRLHVIANEFGNCVSAQSHDNGLLEQPAATRCPFPNERSGGYRSQCFVDRALAPAMVEVQNKARRAFKHRMKALIGRSWGNGMLTEQAKAVRARLAGYVEISKYCCPVPDDGNYSSFN